jgi:hypothetical protein
MGDRPPPRESELSIRWKNMAAMPKENPKAPACLEIYERAKLQRKWIYDPQLKRWQTPEEFLENEKRYSGGEADRLSKLQVRDPMDGINASYVQLQDLKERMEIFVKRVLDYYKDRPKSI